MLQNIRIVLVETSHTGNMGSVARAMKTMGLTNLWLVNPLVKPDSQAIALAAGASDVIGNAHIVDTLDEALAGCSLVALVFGRERVGLTNEELQKCHYHVAIAANPEYSSLNLAMAVQVIAYEVRMAWLATQENGEQVEHEETPYPLVDDLERFYGHLEQTLLATGFIRENHPGQVMNKLRRLFTRARPESQELNILRGILASIEQQNKGNKAE